MFGVESARNKEIRFPSKWLAFGRPSATCQGLLSLCESVYLLTYIKNFIAGVYNFVEQQTANASTSALQSFFWHESLGNCQVLSNTFFSCTFSHTSLHSATTWPLFKELFSLSLSLRFAEPCLRTQIRKYS